MRDARIEGEICREVWNAVYDLREAMVESKKHSEDLSWSSDLVGYVNELIADLGWRFDQAQYFTPVRKPRYEGQEGRLWDAVAALRLALRHQSIGHRGWSCAIDPTVDGLMRGAGYLLRQVRSVWLASWEEP